MVFDAAFLAGTAASLMMNGACCYYQNNREEELREDLREEIRKEWYLQRKRERRKVQEEREMQTSEFEDRYIELLQRSSEEHMSYAERRDIGGNGSSKASVCSYSVNSVATPYPYHLKQQQQQQQQQKQLHRDPPSFNALLISRNSSIMQDVDEDEEEDEMNTDLMYVTATGSDITSVEDVSITSG